MTLTKPIKGIIGACLTPFDENDRVNYKALEKEIDFIVSDCDAITIAAVEAAEYTMLTRDERKEVLRVATEMVNKRVPVILGCSSPSPREVIELAEYSAKVGGDLVQVLMPLRPWGGQPTIAELMEFYTQVASASPLPVTCYHNPGPGADPPQDAFVKISEIDNIRYFKESSRDITKISRLIEQIDIRWARPLFHYDAAFAGDSDARWLGRDDAAAGYQNRRADCQGIQGRGFGYGAILGALLRAISGQMGSLRLAARDEIGNEAFWCRYRQSLPALCAREPA